MSQAVPNFAPFTITNLRRHYASGATPAEVLREIHRRIGLRGDDGVWIHRPTLDELVASVPTDRSLPLFGIPFAVKDNIDVAGWPTTAACPEFAYTPERDAAVVARLRAAGAIPVGKTNLDQFATGLVGTRSPYGIPRSIYDARYLSGGSSSGSAVAVAAGLAAFSLGTDTAGSGRVPAAFNGLVGLKPSKGLLSTRGVVPACRSLDCVSIFALHVADAEIVLALSAGFDPEDAYSRAAAPARRWPSKNLRVGVPRAAQLEFFGDEAATSLFASARQHLEENLGHRCVEIDFAPFEEAAKLLYAGPWVAERLAAIQPFFEKHAEAMDPVVRGIIAGGAPFTAVDTFRAQYELERLRKLADRTWTEIDVLLLPTTGTTYTVEEVQADPVALNSHLGRYTNFVNLLDLCGLALPAGFRPNGLPFGITLLAPAFSEPQLCSLARQFLGEAAAPAVSEERVALAVVGAHLSGQPLHWQLSNRHARLERTCRTAANYRLYALAGTVPPKPGLVRVTDFEGSGLEVEVWSLTPAAFGDFVDKVPAPMVIGTLELEDGTVCKGFLCEPWALEGSDEITHHGGWRAYLARE